MKICYLSNTAVPSYVASAIQIVKMCEAFAKLNNEVILITINDYVSEINLNKYYNIKSKFLLKRIKYFKTFPLGISYYLFSFFSILESFKYKPNIYITRNFFTCFLLVLLKKNIVMELHHDIDTESRIVKFLIKKTKFLNSKYIKKIIAITYGVKDEYVKNNLIKNNKITVLPSGSSILTSFRFTNNKKFLKIGYFGSLFKSRGLNLIHRLAQIDKYNKYYLFGNFKGINRYQLMNCHKNIFFNNYIPYSKIPNELKKMDVLILPYTSSITAAGDIGNISKFTSPLKLFDYLSTGKVIICSNINILKEVIKKNINAIFVENYTNPNSWKDEIFKLKNQPQKRLIISKNNFKLSKKLTLDQRAKIILETINNKK